MTNSLRLVALALALALAPARARAAAPPWNASCEEAPQPLTQKCCAAITSDPARLERMLERSGRDLPFDVGMYEDCVHMPGAGHFLATFLAAPGVNTSSTFFPIAELGVCLPAACGDDDVAFLVRQLLDLVDGEDFRNDTAFAPHGSIAHALPDMAESPTQLLRNCVIKVTSEPHDAPRRPDAWGVCAITLTVLLAALCVGAAFVPAEPSAGGSALLSVPSQRRTADAEAGELREPLLSEPTNYQDLSSATANAVRDTENAGARLARPAAPRPLQTTAASKARAIVKCFDVVNSTSKLFACPAPSKTDSLNGMRVISMFWIILGHTFMMPAAIAGFDNPLDVLSSSYGAKNSWKVQAMLGGESAVDTFFMMSGFLFVWVCYPQAMKHKRGRLPYLGAILHRYLRITPALALSLMLYYKVFAFLGSGPFNARFVHSVNRRCDTSWWTELLYIQNFYPWNSDDVCMGWTWYLGNDFIFFLVSPAFLMVFTNGGMAASPRTRRRNAVLGSAVLGTAIVACTLSNVYLVYKHNLGVNIFDAHYARYTYWAYSKPYTRFPAWAIGMLCALYCKLESKPERRGGEEARAEAPAGEEDPAAPAPASGEGEAPETGADVLARLPASWHNAAVVVATGVMVYLILILVSDFRGDGNNFSQFEEMLWMTFSRPIWALCCGVVTMSCLSGHVPWVNAFLGHPAWVVPARLTFNAYLVHPIVIKTLAGNMTAYYHFSYPDILYRWMGNCVYSFLLAAAVYVLIERPFMSLQTLALSAAKRSRRDRRTDSPSGAPAPAAV